MYCKHAHTYVLICGKGTRLKIHKWYSKQKVSVIVYRDGKRTETYILSKEDAKQFWNFLKQLHKNFLYSKQEYLRHIENKEILVNLYWQMFNDIIEVVKKYANKSSKCKPSSKVSESQ